MKPTNASMEEKRETPDARTGVNANQEAEDDLQRAILASIDTKQNSLEEKLREVDDVSRSLQARRANAGLVKSIGEGRSNVDGVQRRSRLEEMKLSALNYHQQSNTEASAVPVESNSTPEEHRGVASLPHPYTGESTSADEDHMDGAFDDVYQDEDEHPDVEDSKPPAAAAPAVSATYKQEDHMATSREAKEMHKIHQFDHRREISDIEEAVLYTMSSTGVDSSSDPLRPGAVAMPGIGVAPIIETPDDVEDWMNDDEEEVVNETTVVTEAIDNVAVNAVVVDNVTCLLTGLRPDVLKETEVLDEVAGPEEAGQEEEAKGRCSRGMWLAAIIAIVVILAISVPVSVIKGSTDKDPGADRNVTKSGNNTNSTDNTSPDRFASRDELEEAIDAYMEDSSNTSKVAAERGWPINDWDVSGVEYFNEVFSADRNPLLATFNEPIDKWDTGRSRSFFEMFKGAKAFNQNVSFWNMSFANEVQYMFQNAESFNQPMSAWDVSGVVDMTGMLLGTSAFNQDISSWSVSKVKSMASLFSQASSFNQNISGWDVSKVTDFSGMFNDASAFNQNLNSWDVSKATTMEEMFSHAREFNGDVSSWNVSQVTSMHEMFFQAFKFNQDVSNWDVRKVTTMRSLFQDASVFNYNLSKWNVSRVTDLAFMFWKAQEFNQDLSSWDVSQVVSMKRMFAETLKFNQSLSSWNVGNAVDVSFMFQGATEFNQDLESWDISNVADFGGMFVNATTFNHDLCVWGNSITNTSAVVAQMFDNTACPSPLNVSLMATIKGPFCFECQGAANATR